MKPTKPRAKAQPFRLPTLEAFRALTLRQRAALFVKWAASRGAETYDAQSLSDCAFGRLAAAFGLDHPRGVNYGFYTTHRPVQVLPRGGPDSPIHPHTDTQKGTTSTFAALAKRTAVYLKRKGLDWKPEHETVS